MLQAIFLCESNFFSTTQVIDLTSNYHIVTHDSNVWIISIRTIFSNANFSGP